MLTRLKQKVQQMLATQARAANAIGLTPNIITIIGLTLAVLSALAYTQWRISIFYLLVGAVLLLLSGYCDALDGVVARQYQKTTAFGGFLDSLMDRYADAVVYVGIVISGLCELFWGFAALVGSLLVSYARARSEVAGIGMESVGIVERAERLIVIVVASLVALLWQPTTAINIAVALLAVLTNLTVAQRAIFFYKKSKEKRQASN